MDDIIMRKEHKDILQSNLIYFIDNLNELDKIMDILYSNEIFSESIIKDIKENKNSDRIRHFLNKLIKQPDHAYGKFFFALQETKQFHIMKKMDPNYILVDRDVIDSVKNLEDIDIENLEMIPMKASFKKEISKKKNYYNIREADFYGRALIINNIKFEHQSYRIKSDKDAKNLKRCFELLHYKVKLLINLSADDMINELKDEALNIEHETMQSLVVCLMSHGAKDCIYGIDGDDTLGFVTINQIREIFNGDNCRALIGKPKLFFIQACQNKLRRDVMEIGMPIQVSAGSDKSSEYHPLSDIFCFISTVPGESSYRHHEKGALFIQALLYYIYTMAHENSLISISHMVNNMMQTCQVNENGALQMPYSFNTLRKDFYFMP